MKQKNNFCIDLGIKKEGCRYFLMLVVLFCYLSVNVNALELKWVANIGNGWRTQILPVMGDVDNDGVQEIVTSAGQRIVVVNGNNGQIEWTMDGAAATAVELVDLDNDGTPEILYGMLGPKLRAVNGDGTIKWTTPRLKGNEQALFPIVAADIDGDGYPTIYFATEDQYPDPYSGNISEYNGALTMIDHEGNVLKDTWIHHPCWGGLSLADTDFDGNFEVYLGDRREGYHYFPAKGLQVFDAKTLERIWARPDLHHSSPMAIIGDVIGDEKLEVVAQHIVNKGPAVLDAQTGQTLLDYTRRVLPTHATGTLYDLDEDGNMELIMSTSYPIGNNNTPKEFVVFDLVTGEIEFKSNTGLWYTFPPKLGDINDDGKMEILAAAGLQEDRGDYPLLIFDNEYNLIEQINLSIGQLMPVRMYDVDSDGYLELVVAGIKGYIYAFETPTRTPNPAPRTWVQFYSEYRAGAPVYVEPPGKKEPILKNPYPADNSNNISLDTEFSVWVHDYQREPVDLVFELNNGSGWVTIGEINDVGTGRQSLSIGGDLLSAGTVYSWRVTATDSSGYSSTRTMQFRTIDAPEKEWKYKKLITINKSITQESLLNFSLLIEIDDPDLAAKAKSDGSDIYFAIGDVNLSHEIEAYEGGRLVAWLKIPLLSSEEDTLITMYYGNENESVDMESPQDVWTDSYLIVQHFDDELDSTANGNDCVLQNGVTQGEGIVGRGYVFDGVDDRLLVQQLMENQTQFTFEAWVNTNNKQGYIISQRNYLLKQGAFLQYYALSNLFEMYVDENVVKLQGSTGEWHYVVGTFDGTMATIYVDGSSQNSTATTLTWPQIDTYIGDRFVFDRTLNGTIDEVRVSDVARSPAYVEAVYRNILQPEKYIQVGAEEEA
ncbi:MAG: LamG-like jellyroll fold domain-containing protein [Candidatus Woesearchaeota archaeon]